MATATKLDKGIFRHVEAELFRYPVTKREINRLRNDILYGTKSLDENVGGGRGNLPGDPTGIAGTVLATHRKLEHMQKVVDAIETIYSLLPDEKKRLMELRYWSPNQRQTWDGIALTLHVSKMTALRWRDEVVEAIAHEIGWA